MKRVVAAVSSCRLVPAAGAVRIADAVHAECLILAILAVSAADAEMRQAGVSERTLGQSPVGLVRLAYSIVEYFNLY